MLEDTDLSFSLTDNKCSVFSTAVCINIEKIFIIFNFACLCSRERILVGQTNP